MANVGDRYIDSNHPSMFAHIRAIRLRDGATLKRALEATLQLLFEDYSELQRVPSGPTMSRGRRKIDLALMFLRRFEWQSIGTLECSIQLRVLAYLDCTICTELDKLIVFLALGDI